MEAKFEWYRRRNQQGQGYRWHWRLRAPNHEIVASGEAFTRKASCLDSIKAIQKYAAGAEVVEFSTLS
jgi:uncharacterized protein YegP (UPF0339 family)